MTPGIDLDALTALEQSIPPAPWRVAPTLPSPSVRTDGGTELVYATWRDSGPAVLKFIATARNNWFALLSALTATRAEADTLRAEREALLAWARVNLGNSVIHMRIRECFGLPVDAVTMMSTEVHAPAAAPQPDDERWTWAVSCPGCGEAKGHPCIGALGGDGAVHPERRGRAVAFGYGLNAAAGAGDGEQDTATCSCKWSPVEGRIWCDSCAAARNAVLAAASVQGAADGEAQAGYHRDERGAVWPDACTCGGRVGAYCPHCNPGTGGAA